MTDVAKRDELPVQGQDSPFRSPTGHVTRLNFQEGWVDSD